MAIADEDDDIGWCSCGTAWFELVPYDDVDADPDVGAAVCISSEGEITGYAGTLRCLTCGADWTPNQPPLLKLIDGGRVDR